VGVRINWPVELQPMLVHVSVALLCFAFVLDVAAWLWRSQSSRMTMSFAGSYSSTRSSSNDSSPDGS
jgi:uncharacterized membrane protein